MHKEFHKWYSPSLDKEMELVVYGHYGQALLMFPTAAADFLENERFHLIDSIAHHINSGKIKAFSINTVNNESWLNDKVYPPHQSIRHGQFNNYVVNEVVPFIKNHCSDEVPIITTGASVGAYHALNTYFRRPDLFAGVIAMSGVYDLNYYTNGYWDENVYFNSPLNYLPDVTDATQLNQMRNGKIVIATGQGDHEDPYSSQRVSEILNSKGIKHWLDLWGYDMSHDWPTWREMLPYFLDKI